MNNFIKYYVNPQSVKQNLAKSGHPDYFKKQKTLTGKTLAKYNLSILEHIWPKVHPYKLQYRCLYSIDPTERPHKLV